MFSKEESKRIRQEFWISFGKSFPRKWILYNTGVKELSFKFDFTNKYAQVSINLEQTDVEKRANLYTKLVALKGNLTTLIPAIIYEQHTILPNGKEISTIYVRLEDVCIHNKNTWQETMYFLKENMSNLEEFWVDYEDYIKS